jgi:membrane protein
VRRAWRFGKRLAAEWKKDAVADTAAALTYYGVLALFPFLLFLVALISLVLDPRRVSGLVQQLSAVAPPQATQIVSGRLDALARHPSGKLLTIGIVAALWSASGAVGALGQALNRCNDLCETRPLWKTRGLALLVTLGAGVVSVLAALILFAVPVAGALVGGPVGHAITWLRFPVAGLIAMVLWALLYWALPSVRPRFQLLTPGSVAGVVVWLIASWGFSEYVRHSRSYEATYGAIGGMIVLLVWMWLSSAVVLLGAEVNKLLAREPRLRRSPTGEPRGDGERARRPTPRVPATT